MSGNPPPPERAGGDPSELTLSAGQLLINQRVSQAAVPRVNALRARIEGDPPPPEGEGTGGQFDLSQGQLLINRRISQAAVRRVNALGLGAR